MHRPLKLIITSSLVIHGRIIIHDISRNFNENFYKSTSVLIFRRAKLIHCPVSVRASIILVRVVVSVILVSFFFFYGASYRTIIIIWGARMKFFVFQVFKFQD